jgi:hypothetical protein
MACRDAQLRSSVEATLLPQQFGRRRRLAPAGPVSGLDGRDGGEARSLAAISRRFDALVRLSAFCSPVDNVRYIPFCSWQAADGAVVAHKTCR